MRTAARALARLWGLALGAAAWPDLPSLIDGADEASYLSVLSLVLEATKLSYTGTFGSYRNPGDVNASLSSGWQRFRGLDVDPPTGGFHGLVFFHAPTGRSILAFRGTDLNSSTASGLADKCADRLLWENATWESLPAECRRFPPGTLDYLKAAENFTDRTLAALPVMSKPLLVGHSLGAGLAVLVAAGRERERRWRPSVLAVSAPPFGTALRQRVGRDPAELEARRFAVIYNRFDPVYERGSAGGGLAGATLCPYSPPEPDACALCYAAGTPEDAPACEECFARTHVLRNYLRDLNGTVELPPPYRPRCPLVVAWAALV